MIQNNNEAKLSTTAELNCLELTKSTSIDYSVGVILIVVSAFTNILFKYANHVSTMCIHDICTAKKNIGRSD